MIKKINILLADNDKYKLLIIFLCMLIVGLLEMIGIGSIPLFVVLISQPDLFLSKIPDIGFLKDLKKFDIINLIFVSSAFLAFLFFIKNILIGSLSYIEASALRSMIVSISKRLFKIYLLNPYSYHLEKNPAELIKNITFGVDKVRELFSESLLFLRECLILIVILSLLVIFDPSVSFISVIILAFVSALFFILVKKKLEKNGILLNISRAQEMQRINQGLGALKEAKLMKREGHFISRFTDQRKKVEDSVFFIYVLNRMPRLFLEVVAISSILLVTILFVYFKRDFNLMLPILSLLAVSTVRMIPAFNAITSCLSLVKFNLPFLNSIVSEISAYEKNFNNTNIKTDIKNISTSKVNIKNEIKMEKIYFKYPTSSKNILDGVSLSIKSGSATAIMGSTGVGKSTIINTLLGLLAPTSGQITADNININSILSNWQKSIGYIPQDIYLIDDSIKRNIAFGLSDEEIDDSKLKKVAKLSHIDKFIETLPNGINTEVGDRGIRLSGGQKQRIGIARALYNDPSIIVMDEATSAVDIHTEQNIMDEIYKIKGDRILIIISHRMTTVKDCDKIYLLKNGKVEEIKKEKNNEIYT